MTKAYRELVAIQVTFSKVVSEYSLAHFYRWQSKDWTSGTIVMQGYDMARVESVETITECLRKAYTPAIINIWKQDVLASTSEVMQFTEAASPDFLGLDGPWTHWAQL